MLGQIDPKKMATMQELSKHIDGKIIIDYVAGTVNVELSSSKPEAVAIIPMLVGQFGEALAQQLSAFFAIQGEIIERNKPPEMK